MANFPKPKTEVTDYVLVSHRELPPEEQTVWKLKSLPIEDWGKLADVSLAMKQKEGSEPEFSFNSGTSAIMAARRGIVGWENLQVGGQDVKFIGGKEEDDGYKRITQKEMTEVFSSAKWAITELGKEVIKLSSLTETEKNS